MSLPALDLAELHVTTETYDGPLDLLLYLVERDGIDLHALPLAHITREYLAWIDRMQELDLDIAGEFLVMAATLCELKSRELLPRSARSVLPAEEEDPRQALIQRMIEYRRYREAAGFLGGRLWLGRDLFVRETVPLALFERPIDPGVDVFGLLDAFHSVLHRSQNRPVHDIHREKISWPDCVRNVLIALDDGATRSLDELWDSLPSRAHRVLTFLAVLELARTSMIEINQRSHLSPVFLKSRVKAATADLKAIEEAS